MNEWKEILKKDTDIEKFFGRKQQQPQFTADGIKFANQNDLNTYNQAKSSLGAYSSVLTNYLRNQGNVFMGSQTIQQGISQAQRKQQQGQQQAQQARQKYQQSTRNQSQRTTDKPHESVWRRPAY